MKPLHYLNGNWVDEKEAKISVFDLAVLRGFGCFDFLRTYNQKPFLIDDHINRFFNSAKSLGLKIDKSKNELKKIISIGINKNKNLAKDLNIRMILTGGVSKDSLSIGKPSLIILFGPATVYPKIYYQKGVKVITYSAKRDLPEIKSLNYIFGMKAYQEAKRQNAVESLYVFQQKILEGTTSNFFAVIKKKLVTPKKDILFGITRNLVIYLAKKLKIKIEERDVFFNEIKKFDEAFITSSNREIMPVIKINEEIIGNGRVGKITKRLMNEFNKFILSNY